MKFAYALTAAVALVPFAAAQAAITATGSVTDNYAPVVFTPTTTSYTASGAFTIAASGDGSVEVHAGESLTVGVARMGEGGVGSLTVSGAGATFNHGAGTFAIGNGNAGTLTVSNGAVANVTHLSLAEGNATSTGVLNITGATVTTSQNFYGAYFGTGTTNINAGGSLNVSRFVSLSQIGGSNGTININGANARMTLSSNFVNVSGLRLGYGGNGTLNVSNGGTLTVAPGTVNHVTFNSGDLTTGNGTLNLLSGGTVDLAGTSSLLKGTGTGTATFNFTGGTLKNAVSIAVPVNQQGGTFTAGSSTSAIGTTTLTAGYTLGPAGTLQVDLAGSGGVAGTDFDYYAITGAANLNGYVALLTANGFTPTIGQTFNVLTAGTVDITGATAGGWGLSVISGGNGQILQATYVPEPAALALVGLGAMAGLRRRRR